MTKLTSILPVKMPGNLPIILASPGSLSISLTIVVLIVLVTRSRQLVIRPSAKCFMLIGSVCLALAAGRPIWNLPSAGTVTVMVDLSPSTRGATFRDRSALLTRIQQLVGDNPYEIVAFSDQNQRSPRSLSDLPCDKTIFAPPPCDAVLLFSDGQFDLPSYAPPTYPVIDPALDHPADAAVSDLIPFGKKVIATIRNNAATRPVTWSGASPDNVDDPKKFGMKLTDTQKSEASSFSQLATPSRAGEMTVSIAPGDLWPENDSLSLLPPPPVNREKWWIGQNAPAGWQMFDPGDLPTDSTDYLRPVVIVLKNVPAASLSSIQQQRLLQYVRDLGGSLVIVGGNHAFAAGAYDGTPLDDLSPLASSPPNPTLQWLLLIDASGSMAGDGSNPSPWQSEISAVTQLLPQLPAQDSVSIGSFAKVLKWWSTGKSASDTRRLQLPPPNISPGGPTNLAAALSQIDSSTSKSTPSQLLLMTDADADLPNADDLARSFVEKHVSLSLLAIGQGRALPALQALALATGGSVQTQLDPNQWITSANLLLRSALPARYQHQPIQTNDRRMINEWNQTWMKSSASALERSVGITLAASWQVGLGQVAALAYPADNEHIAFFADKVVTQPSDPRFTVTITTGSIIAIKVTAVDRDQYLNGQLIQLTALDTQSGFSENYNLLQSGPGRYERSIPAKRSMQLVSIRNPSGILGQFAVAGRYPPEFDHIGNDHANLQSLADRTGGAVIAPGPVQPIQFHWPKIQTPITSEFAFTGFVFISLGLIRHRRA